MTVYLTIGVPASGKSTWAKAQVLARKDAVIVCRDDIRLAHGLGHGENETFVSNVHRAQIRAAVQEGMDVIVADTNINQKFRRQLIKFCHEHAQDVEIHPFKVSPESALERDRVRAERVGDDVILRMFKDLDGQDVNMDEITYLPAPTFSPRPAHNPEKHNIFIVDIDGTVADHHGVRGPFDESKVLLDKPIEDVITVVQTLHKNIDVVFASGRRDTCREDTAEWINRHVGIDVNNPASGAELMMRKANDNRPDYVIKGEIYDELMRRYNIIVSFDDRDQVVTHVRARGITVAQVAPGNF